MKRKINFLAAVLIPILSFFILTSADGCKSKNAALADEGIAGQLGALFNLDSEGVSQELVEAVFALDFTPLSPEPPQTADTIDDSGPAQQTAAGVVVGGGLRKQLSDYKTEYLNPEKEAARIAAIQEAQAKAAAAASVKASSKDPLTVIDWGPRGFFSSKVQRPSLYVVFSEPMVPLSALGTPSNTSPLVSINPPLKGSFRWYGTSFLSFEGDENCQPQQNYRITVSSDTKSLSGKTISGDTTFFFYTESLKLNRIVPGEEFRKETQMYFSNDAVPPQAAKNISLYFNYPVKADDIRNYLDLFVVPRQDGSSAPVSRRFRLVDAEPAKLIAQVEGDVPFNSQVRVVLKEGAKSANATLGTTAAQILTFGTPGPFRAMRTESTPGGGGSYRNLVSVYFSANLKEDTVRANLSALSESGTLTIGQENITVNGSMLRIVNLPVSSGDIYTLTVGTGIQDMYGRRLESPYVTEVRVPDPLPPSGQANFLHYSYGYVRSMMLESQFEPRYLFEYSNVTDKSFYQLGAVRNPLSPEPLSPKNFSLNTERNRPHFAEMDLKPYLNKNNQGFVSLNASLELLTADYDWQTSSYKTGTRTTYNNLSLQVTDLGLTVRCGFNKVAVLVSSLSTGKPVQDAKVYLIPRHTIQSEMDIAKLPFIEEGITDKNGLVVFNLKAGAFSAASKRGSNEKFYDAETIYVYAEKDEDKAVFQPTDHNTWFFNVRSRDSAAAEKPEAVTFMFTDRGLYKPGEILSYRGVDRTLALGNYFIYKGKYTVTLQTDSYYDSKTITTIEGETSESGGFYGTITLPDDLSPEPYRLVYRRVDDEEAEPKPESANVPVTVAFFERLKFEAVISPPAETVYAGDTINMNLKASYLSGGSLSGASYTENWHRSLTWFTPPGPQAREFSFGPQNAWDGSTSLSSNEGVLGGSGSVALRAQTQESSITGAAYRYTATAWVTDLSNQMISASRSVVVHPARFYLGIAAPSTKGFPKTGQELSFNYAAFTPSGALSERSDWLAAGPDAGKMKVEFIRDEWHVVQQKGVAGYVYDQYVKQTVTESSQSINLRNEGSIKFTPSKSGYYTMRVTAKDSKGRTALSEYSFYVTGKGGGYWDMGRSDEIRLTPDEDQYNPGDTAQILMQSALPGGYYLITIEREGIFSEEVKYLQEGTTVLEIPIARNYVPVVYVSVASYSVRKGPPVHQYGEPDLDKPKGHYGVTMLKVNPRVKAFSVSIEEAGNRIYRPGETVTMTLKAERNGRPVSGAELTLMAVDRGVLDLINYRVPDPINYFYNHYRFPLSVHGGDSRSLLIDPVTYSIKNLAGGDAEDSKMEERKDFNPTAVFEPMLKTGNDGKVKVKFKLPDNLTTYRVTVFGVQNDLFALKESEIAARNKINVQKVLPRRLRERDTAEAGVLITNMDTQSHTITVSLAISPGSGSTENGLAKLPGSAIVDGVAERKITLKSGENGVVYFDLAAQKEGYINCNFTIKSSALNERLINELYIERPYVMETVTTLGEVADKTKSAQEGLVIPGWADNGVGSLNVSLDATRLGLLDASVNYLFDYPYGCLEQRSSAVLPLLIFGEYLDVFNLKSKVPDPKKVVEAEIKSWAPNQQPDGGFPYWPGNARSDFYVSMRIAHIIAIAREKRFSVPSSIDVNRLVSYLNNEFRKSLNWGSNSSGYSYRAYLQAYHLYIFTLLGQNVEPSRLAEIAARSDADAASLAYVGLAYRKLNRNNDADAVGKKIRNLIRSDARGADITDPRDNGYFYHTYYGNKIEQLALTLEFFVQQYPGDAINGRLLHSLLNSKRAEGFWKSTAVTARMLSAIDALIKAENLEKVNVSGTITLAGTELFKDSYKGLGAKPSGKNFDFKASPLSTMKRDSSLPLVINRSGTGALYYTASMRYAIPSEIQGIRDEGLGVFITYTDAATGREIAGAALQSGKIYQARIRVSTNRDRTFVALRAPVPSGAEILDSTFVTTPRFSETEDESDRWSYWYDPRQPSSMIIMDNEVRYFWDNFAKGEASVQFLFRTSRRGVYPTPPVQAECMYESEIFGRTKGLLFTIE